MIEVALISQDLSQGVLPYIDTIDQALMALGPIGIQDLVLTRREGFQRGAPKLDLTVSYVTPGPLMFRAIAFGGRSGDDVDALSAAFFAANPGFRAHFIRDVGDDRRGSLMPNVIMVVYSEVSLSNCGYNRARVIIVEALADIAAGASGPAQVVGASGVLPGQVISIVNRFDSTWATGARGYASPRNGSCTWDGYKTCC
jgi:hypothetical protein